MRNRGKIFDWGFWKPTPDPVSLETKLTIARRKIFARITRLESQGLARSEAGRALRQRAGQRQGIARAFLLWRAHRLEDAAREDLRAVVALRKAAKQAGLDGVGHRVARRQAFRDASGGES